MERLSVPGYEWVSCNEREYGSAGYRIHLIATATRKRPHWQGTVCGAMANLRGIWRKPPANSPKELCEPCRKAAARMKSQGGAS